MLAASPPISDVSQQIEQKLNFAENSDTKKKKKKRWAACATFHKFYICKKFKGFLFDSLASEVPHSHYNDKEISDTIKYSNSS